MALISSDFSWPIPLASGSTFSLFSCFLAGRSKTYDVLRELFKIIEIARPCQLFFRISLRFSFSKTVRQTRRPGQNRTHRSHSAKFQNTRTTGNGRGALSS
jgi:hypothetical protein